MTDIQIKQIEEILTKRGLEVDTLYNPKPQILEFYIKNSGFCAIYAVRYCNPINVYEFVNMIFRDFKMVVDEDDDDIDENWEHMPY